MLITATGEGTIGRVDVYPYEESAIADGHVTICRLNPDINLRYVVEFLRSEFGQIQMLRFVSGSTGQTELLIDHIKALRIPMPDRKTQNEIVKLMDQARKKSGDLLEQAKALRNQGANLMGAARQEMMGKISGE